MAVTIVTALAFVLAGMGFLILLGSALRRRPLRTAGPSGNKIISADSTLAEQPNSAPTAALPLAVESAEFGVNRRKFLNRASLLAMSVFGVGFGGGSLAFLWPNKISGFGGNIFAGNLDELLKQIKAEKKPIYNPEGRFYLVAYDTSDEDNPYVKEGVAVDGIMAMYQKCAHLGCRVPFCESAQWFECPCHGSKYNNAGEVQPGSPAPAGLWRFRVQVDGGKVTVDTSKSLAQPAFGVDTINQPPAGPHCTASGEGTKH